MAHLLENMVELMLSLKNIGHFLDGGIKGFQTYHIVNYSSSIGWHVESYFLAVNQKIKSLYYGILQGQNVRVCIAIVFCKVCEVLLNPFLDLARGSTIL